MRLNWDKTMELYSGDDDYLTHYYSDNQILSSYEYFFTVKPLTSTTTDDSDALYKQEPTDMVYSDEGTKVIIRVQSSDVRIAVGTYKYDIQRKDKFGRISTILAGLYKVTNDITKRTS